MSVWEVENLSVGFGARPVVEGLGYAIGAGECVALVGESGSGKSQSWLAPFGLSPGQANGSVRLLGHELVGQDEAALRRLRGAHVGFVFQQPLSALTPHLSIGAQLAEKLVAPDPARLEAMLAEVGIDRPAERLKQFPHQLSGGQRQRAMIAMAIAHAPELLVADEPTTALDASLRHDILLLLDRLRRERGMAVLLVSHDLASVARHADRVVVMRQGRMVESGAAGAIFQRPCADYTRDLVAATPRLDMPVPPLPDIGAALLEAGNIVVRFRRPGWRGGWIDAVKDVSLRICEGEAVALVGGSGSGKSTLARAIARLGPLEGGAVRWRGVVLPGRNAMKPGDRKGFQPVFQDPVDSLDPRWPAWKSVEEPLLRLRPELDTMMRREKVAAALGEVGLDAELAERRPGALSGGQAQRVALARALVSDPDLLILDEATSALDVSVQARIVALLQDIQRRRRLALLFISHDLALVRQLCHRVVVLDRGEVVEAGDTRSLIESPRHPVTRRLVEASQ